MLYQLSYVGERAYRAERVSAPLTTSQLSLNIGVVLRRRYNSTGQQTGIPGSYSRINAATSGSQANPSVALNDDGDGVVMWGSDESDANGLAGELVARRLARNEAFTTGSEITVDSSAQYVNGGGSALDIANDASFAAAWRDYNGSSKGFDVYTRRFGATNAGGSTSIANKVKTDDQEEVAVAITEAGGAWAVG